MSDTKESKENNGERGKPVQAADVMSFRRKEATAAEHFRHRGKGHKTSPWQQVRATEAGNKEKQTSKTKMSGDTRSHRNCCYDNRDDDRIGQCLGATKRYAPLDGKSPR